VVEAYLQALNRVCRRHEILLVVNGPCRDDSLGVCRALAAAHREVRVLHSAAGGWGLAVRLGLAEAGGEVLCYTNSARTAAEDLARAVLLARDHPDAAIKARRRIRAGLLRRLGSLFYNLECRLLLGLRGGDVNGTPKVFPRHMGRLLELKRDDDLIDAEFGMICRRQRYPLVEMPVFVTRRHGGESTTRLRSALRMYRGALDLRRQYRGAAHG
jgi:hypothetical protein